MGGGSSKQKASDKSDTLEKNIELRKDEKHDVKQEVRLSIASNQSSRKRAKSCIPDGSPRKSQLFDEKNIR
jgi:hypothetical protein